MEIEYNGGDRQAGGHKLIKKAFQRTGHLQLILLNRRFDLTWY